MILVPDVSKCVDSCPKLLHFLIRRGKNNIKTHGVQVYEFNSEIYWLKQNHSVSYSSKVKKNTPPNEVFNYEMYWLKHG